MRGKHGHHVSGPSHPRWSEDRMISDEGYVKLRVGVDHPLADPNGYAYEHLVVWVAAGNPRPPKGQLIHHKNEHRTDNRYSNLELLTDQAHAGAHDRLKLSTEAVRDIRARYAAGQATQAQLGAEYGIPHTRISKVVRGEIWRRAGGPISAGDNRFRDPKTGKVIGKKTAGRLLDGREWNEVPG